MIIVMGLPGVGKSTVLGIVSEKPGYRILNYGTLMFDIAKREFGIKERDEMRKLDQEKQKKVQAKVGDALSKETGKVILDTHCSISTPTGYLVGLPDPILAKLKVERLIYITAPIAEIVARRKNDPTRVRDADPEAALKAHDDYNRKLLAHYSEKSRAPSTIIYNYEGKLNAAQAELLSLL
ncbi:Adenylate kinase [uncultured archaeon]|nr:Adenylate kinase [uncultured archaeon]